MHGSGHQERLMSLSVFVGFCMCATSFSSIRVWMIYKIYKSVRYSFKGVICPRSKQENNDVRGWLSTCVMLWI